MKLFTYVITHDTGFAPNPFWGYCTLACCKPVIRRCASVGDWVVGLSPKANGNRLVYAMQVEEVVPFAKYYQSQNEYFKKKIPPKDPNEYQNSQAVYKRGDNIYMPIPPLEEDNFQQLPSMHSKWMIVKADHKGVVKFNKCGDKSKALTNGDRFHVSEDPATKKRDLGGEKVLISKNFYYFGSASLNLSPALQEAVGKLKLGIGQRVTTCPATISLFKDFITNHALGIHARPTIWPSDDGSWRTSQR